MFYIIEKQRRRYPEQIMLGRKGKLIRGNKFEPLLVDYNYKRFADTKRPIWMVLKIAFAKIKLCFE